MHLGFIRTKWLEKTGERVIDGRACGGGDSLGKYTAVNRETHEINLNNDYYKIATVLNIITTKLL